jgi:hypothetical protein
VKNVPQTYDEDELEIERVKSAVSWKSYDCIDFDYREWVDGFIHMASYWAIQHWQLCSRQMGTLALLHLLLKREKEDQAEEAMIQLKLFESRLLALDRALEAVCEEHGLDIQAARNLAGTQPFDPMLPDLTPDAAYQEDIQAKLSRCLPIN